MVLLERIELSASPLPRECSTTELQQRPRWNPGLSKLPALFAQADHRKLVKQATAGSTAHPAFAIGEQAKEVGIG